MSERHGGVSSDPVVALAADEAYALPLAVTVRSALEALAPGRSLEVCILDGGILPRTRERLLRSWHPGRVRVRWLAVDPHRLRDLRVAGHATALTFARALLPELLADRERAIYLDCDLLVQGDLAELWARPFGDAACLAAQDAGAPFIDADRAPAARPEGRAWILTPRPVANYAELGLDPGAPYFNAGVLLVDLARWRTDGVGDRLLRCLREQRRHARFWDQYAVNVVLAGRIGRLDTRWNASQYLRNYPSWRESPFHEEEFARALADPAIVHYLGPDKPWQLGSRVVHADRWHAHRSRTAWSGWAGLAACAGARLARERRRLAKRVGRTRKALRSRRR